MKPHDSVTCLLVSHFLSEVHLVAPASATIGNAVLSYNECAPIQSGRNKRLPCTRGDCKL